MHQSNFSRRKLLVCSYKPSGNYWLVMPDFKEHWNKASDSFQSYLGVSKNNGTPKSWILIGFSIIFTIHFGIPDYFWKHPLGTWNSKWPEFLQEFLLQRSIEKILLESTAGKVKIVITSWRSCKKKFPHTRPSNKITWWRVKQRFQAIHGTPGNTHSYCSSWNVWNPNDSWEVGIHSPETSPACWAVKFTRSPITKDILRGYSPTTTPDHWVRKVVVCHHQVAVRNSMAWPVGDIQKHTLTISGPFLSTISSFHKGLNKSKNRLQKKTLSHHLIIHFPRSQQILTHLDHIAQHPILRVAHIAPLSGASGHNHSIVLVAEITSIAWLCWNFCCFFFGHSRS